MIEINYNNDNIHIKTLNLDNVFDELQLPLRFEFVRQVNNKKIWDVNLNSNSWATFPDTEMIDVIVRDNCGCHIFTHKWNVITNGTFFYQKLWNYCKLKPNSKGVVIGTHNGEFGEWVPVVQDNLSNIVLVEASEKQFIELSQNFLNYNDLNFINDLVTDDGEDILFYEGGKGYTNSVEKRVIEYWETEEITETLRSSIKFSNLITKDVTWIHLDVEGIDDRLLYSLSDEQFSHLDLIIFEYNNLSTEKREKINDFIISKGFIVFRENGICIAYK